MRTVLALLFTCPLALDPGGSPESQAGGQAGPDAGEVEALLIRIQTERDFVDPDVITDLARLRSAAAFDGLVLTYDWMQSVFMRRHALRRARFFEGVEGLEARTLEWLGGVARTSTERQLRGEAAELVAGFRARGLSTLASIVDSRTHDDVRELALRLFVGIARPDSDPWLRRLWLPPPPLEPPTKKRGKKGSELQPAPIPELPVLREIAFQALVPRLTVEELVQAFQASGRVIRLAALRELDARGDGNAVEFARELYESGRRSRNALPADQLVGARILARREGADMAKRFIADGTRGDASVELALGLAALVAEFEDASVEKQVLKQVGKGKGGPKLFFMRAARRIESERLNRTYVKLLADREQGVRRLASELVAERGQTEAVPELIDLLLDTEDPRDVLSCVLALSVLNAGDDWNAALPRYAAHPDVNVRNAALEELAKARPEGALEVFETALAHENWSTRLAAAGGIGVLAEPAGVGLLAARIPEETGRMRFELAEILWSLTGQPFEENGRMWDEWWKAEGDSFELPTDAERREFIRKREELYLKQISKTKRRASSSGPGLSEAEEARFLGKTERYYGIDIVSQRVVFVLDVSGSMDERLRGEGDELGEPRIGLARRELAHAIDGLDRDAIFNVILFSSDINAWSPEMLTRNEEANILEAKAFLNDFSAGGGTNLYGGLERAFEEPGVDTIFVVSDGEPSAGDVVEPGAIVDAVRAWNEYLGVRVHCVSVGGSLDVLERIAAECDGEYVEFR